MEPGGASLPASSPDLGQIHSALAYYWDHREELDRDVKRRLERVDELQSANRPSEIAMRLAAQGS